ncbi:MAG TPA: hypothetical protein VI306_08595 [Pyrinomonadaceae bacterium]
MTLEPGEHWEPTIYENIDRSDVFFLSWSRAAPPVELKDLHFNDRLIYFMNT